MICLGGRALQARELDRLISFPCRFEYFSFSSPERAWRLAMASWDRYGEDKKYRKDVDVNDNPKQLCLVGRRRFSGASRVVLQFC